MSKIENQKQNNCYIMKFIIPAYQWSQLYESGEVNPIVEIILHDSDAHEQSASLF